jgi:hypothetical protein
VPDREAYAAQQAQLLDALLRGGDPPPGFVAAQADAAGRSLRRKRGRAIAKAWPALALDLGATFDARFDAFARAVDAPPSGHPLEDGLSFARSLARADGAPRLGDDARAEHLLARAALRRHGVFAGAAWLLTPRPRLLVAVRLPALGAARVTLALPRTRRARG